MNGGNNIQGFIHYVVRRKRWIEFPDCCHRRNVIDLSDLSHDVNDSEIQHMGQAWQMMLDRIERIDIVLFKD